MKNLLFIALSLASVGYTYGASDEIDLPDKAPPAVQYRKIVTNVPMPKWENPLPKEPYHSVLEPTVESKIAGLEERVTRLELTISAMQREAIMRNSERH